jgi:hypothetical protein
MLNTFRLHLCTFSSTLWVTLLSKKMSHSHQKKVHKCVCFPADIRHMKMTTWLWVMVASGVCGGGCVGQSWLAALLFENAANFTWSVGKPSTSRAPSSFSVSRCHVRFQWVGDGVGDGVARTNGKSAVAPLAWPGSEVPHWCHPTGRLLQRGLPDPPTPSPSPRSALPASTGGRPPLAKCILTGRCVWRWSLMRWRLLLRLGCCAL